jgi:hypothetical protein
LSFQFNYLPSVESGDEIRAQRVFTLKKAPCHLQNWTTLQNNAPSSKVGKLEKRAIG